MTMKFKSKAQHDWQPNRIGSRKVATKAGHEYNQTAPNQDQCLRKIFMKQ